MTKSKTPKNKKIFERLRAHQAKKINGGGKKSKNKKQADNKDDIKSFAKQNNTTFADAKQQVKQVKQAGLTIDELDSAAEKLRRLKAPPEKSSAPRQKRTKSKPPPSGAKIATARDAEIATANHAKREAPKREAPKAKKAEKAKAAETNKRLAA